MVDAVAGAQTSARELISFMIGVQEFCLDIGVVREIRGWTETTPMPYAPNYVHGVINLRGTVMPVVDLCRRLGLGETIPTQRHVIIVAMISGQLVGLLVDAVCETLTINPDEIQMPPELGSEAARNFLKGVLSIDGRMVTIIGLDSVLPGPLAEAA
jgi:purine-binding chemotaxis protein CheW